jgi:Domain of unknown function (DUF4281)
MDALQPVLFGFTTKDLWDCIHPAALAGWGLLLLAPRWERTFDLVLIPPLLHATLYASIWFPMILFPSPDGHMTVDISKMESVFALFQKPDVFFVGWVHYLAFDLLVGRGLAMDAVQHCNVTYLQYYLVVVPCLLGTFYVGPVGFLIYMLLRLVGIVKPSPTMASKKKRT